MCSILVKVLKVICERFRECLLLVTDTSSCDLIERNKHGRVLQYRMTLIWSRIRPNLIKTWRRGNNHFCSDLSCYRCWTDDVPRKGDQIERGWVKSKQAKPRFTQPCDNFFALHDHTNTHDCWGQEEGFFYRFSFFAQSAQVRLIGMTPSRINLEI